MYRAQFLNEASLAGKLKHPHIVTIYDAVVQEDSGHVAMELVTGGDLSQHVKPETLLPVADVLQIAFKCCGALDYALRARNRNRRINPAAQCEGLPAHCDGVLEPALMSNRVQWDTMSSSLRDAAGAGTIGATLVIN